MARSVKYKNIRSNLNVAFVPDDEPAPQAGAAGVRSLEVRGIAEPATVPAGPGAHGHLASRVVLIRPRRVLAFNVDPDHPGLQAREVEGDAVYGARWPQ